MSYKQMKIDLTEKQAMTALKGKAIRVTADQINRGSTFVSLHPMNAQKVEKAFLKKKGVSLHLSKGELAETAQQMGGAGFWGNIWKGIKSVWKVLKDSGALSQLADMAVAPVAAYSGQPALVATGRKLLKDTTGIGVCKGGSIAVQQEASRKRMTKQDKYEQLRAAGIFLS